MEIGLDNYEHHLHPMTSNPTESDWQHDNRMLRMVNSCNQAMIRSLDEATLLQRICSIIVEVGEYSAAWIGRVELGTGSINPVAHAGDVAQHRAVE